MAASADNDMRTVRAHAAPDAAAAHASTLESRLVREAGRDTWFVINRHEDPISALDVELANGGGVRRVVVNGEPVEFTEHDDRVECLLERSLRPGQGTNVVVHYR